MVNATMSSAAQSQEPSGVLITHPNRDKAVVRTTRAVVILLLLISAGLVLVVTAFGWNVLEGAVPIEIGYILVYLLLAFFAGRWNRGVLPVGSALAVLLAIFALVAAPGWFARDKTDYVQPALNASLLGLLTLLIIPVQILLVVFAMRGFSQGWNVELERRDPGSDAADYGDVAPHPA